MMKNNTIKIIGVVIIVIGFFGLFFIKQYSKDSIYNDGYESGYKDAKLIYECDHDRAECEIIKDSIDAN